MHGFLENAILCTKENNFFQFFEDIRRFGLPFHHPSERRPMSFLLMMPSERVHIYWAGNFF